MTLVKRLGPSQPPEGTPERRRRDSTPYLVMAAMLIFSGVALTVVDQRGEERTKRQIALVERRDIRLVRASLFDACERVNYFRFQHNGLAGSLREFLGIAETRARANASDKRISPQNRRVSRMAAKLYHDIRVTATDAPLVSCWRQVYGHGVPQAVEARARRRIWADVRKDLRAEQAQG